MIRNRFQLALLLAAPFILNACASNVKTVEQAFQEYLAEDFPDTKVLVYSEISNKWTRTYGFPLVRDAYIKAMSDCQSIANHCKLYAVGNERVDDLSETEKKQAMQKYEASLQQTPKPKGTETYLAGDEIKAAFNGEKLIVKTASGLRLTVALADNGCLKAIPELGQNLPAFMATGDTGKWWIRGKTFCRQFTKWFDGASRCHQISEENGLYLLYYKGKVSSTARIEKAV